MTRQEDIVGLDASILMAPQVWKASGHIDGFSALLREHIEPTLDDKGRRYLDKIAKSSAQMGQLIDDLLAFSRMGRVEMYKIRVSLDCLSKEVI